MSEMVGETEFKDSPVSQIPEGWETVKQGHVANFINGRAYKLSEWEKDGVPVIRLQNLTNHGGEFYYSNLNLPEHQYCYRGDLLYMWSASFGVYIWWGDKAIFHYHIWKVTQKEEYLCKDFHMYLLEFKTQEWKASTSGSTMLHLTKSGMEKLEISLPPIDEQKTIASILASVDKAIEKTESQISKLQDLKKGMMQELLTKGIGHTKFKDSPVGRIPVGWEVKKIANLGGILTGRTPKTSELNYYGGQIPFISPADLGNKSYIDETKTYLTPDGLNQTRKLTKNTVLVTCIGSTIGKTGITAKTCATNQQINSIICKENDYRFVFQLMTFHRDLLRSLAGTQAVPIVNKNLFSSILVQSPPLAEQQKIASILSSIDSKIEVKQQKLQQTQNLKKSLMQDLLTGKVRVKTKRI